MSDLASIALICAYCAIWLAVAIKVTASEIADCPCGMPTYHAAGGLAVGAVWPCALVLLGLVYVARRLSR